MISALERLKARNWGSEVSLDGIMCPCLPGQEVFTWAWSLCKNHTVTPDRAHIYLAPYLRFSGHTRYWSLLPDTSLCLYVTLHSQLSLNLMSELLHYLLRNQDPSVLYISHHLTQSWVCSVDWQNVLLPSEPLSSWSFHCLFSGALITKPSESLGTHL